MDRARRKRLAEPFTTDVKSIMAQQRDSYLIRTRWPCQPIDLNHPVIVGYVRIAILENVFPAELISVKCTKI
jgi:hypothetical protein